MIIAFLLHMVSDDHFIIQFYHLLNFVYLNVTKMFCSLTRRCMWCLTLENKIFWHDISTLSMPKDVHVFVLLKYPVPKALDLHINCLGVPRIFLRGTYVQNGYTKIFLRVLEQIFSPAKIFLGFQHLLFLKTQNQSSRKLDHIWWFFKIF